MQKAASIIVGMLAGTTLGSCASGGAANGEPRAPIAAPLVSTTPEVVFVPEMAPLPGVDERDAAITPGVRAAFDAELARIRPFIAARVTTDELVAASRWARDQTRGFAPSPGWIDSMPMEPIGMAGGAVVMGQRAENSPIVLPAHVAVVHRRLIVAAVFDPVTGSIGRVLVTIRGWAEE